MAEPIRPESALTRGRKNTIWVPAIADIFVPKVSELTATSAFDITRVLFASSAAPSQTTERTTGERRWGDTKAFQRLGDSTVEGGDLLFAVDPQADDADPEKKAWTTFKDGATGFLVRRFNVLRSTAVAAGQFVTVYPASVGSAFEIEQGEGSTAEAAFTAPFIVTDEPAQMVEVVTGS